MAELDKSELVVIECLVVGVGEDVPGLGDEIEGLISERKVVALGVQEEGEAPVVVSDELYALGQVAELEDAVPVGLLAVYERLAGDEGVDHREDAIHRLLPGVGLPGPEREAPGPMEVARGQKLLRRREPPLCFRSSAVHSSALTAQSLSLSPCPLVEELGFEREREKVDMAKEDIVVDVITRRSTVTESHRRGVFGK